MTFLDFIHNSFRRILSVDTEYRTDPSGTIPHKVVCFVYQDIFTGETFRYWEHDGRITDNKHFDYDDCLLVCFNAVAEVGSYLKLLHGKPDNIWDCYVENARLYKPFRSGPGALSLLACANFYNIPGVMPKEEKDKWLDVIINNESYTQEQETGILDYCQRDVEATVKVFIEQVKDIEKKNNLKTIEDFERELWQVCFRGYSQGCVAQVERNGIPIDVQMVNEFKDYWPKVKDRLIEKYNKEINLFEGLKFNNNKFTDLVNKLGLSSEWPRLKSGKYATDIKTIARYVHIPEIKKFQEIRTFLNMTKLTNYDCNYDGKARTTLFMFGTVTSRCTPSTAKYIFNGSAWARNFICPTWGHKLVYVDYSQQEPAIMGYLSKDQKLIQAYQSGDVYIHSAKLCKMIPESATRKTHPEMRDVFKELFLANGYGAGPGYVSQKLKVSLIKAKQLQLMFREVYHVYFNWIESIIAGATATGYLSTEYGWQRFIKSFTKKYKDGRRKDIGRSLLNWPVQSNGADVLRQAMVDLTNNHFEVCALVHDAVLLQIPIPEFKQRLDEAKQIMVGASIKVVGGPIRVDHEEISGNWQQKPELQKTFDDIMNEIKNYKKELKTEHTTDSMVALLPN